MNNSPAASRPTTPYLQFDRTVLQRNITTMAQWAAERGVQLRPHVKTHKSIEFAQLQLAAGASGITVATIGEAEVFAAAGFADIFIAYPLWITPERAERLERLEEQTRVVLGVDSVDSLQHSLGVLTRPFDWRIEIDSGHHRSGILPADIIPIARVLRDVGHRLDGIFTFPGHSYSATDRKLSAEQEAEALSSAAILLTNDGFVDLVISGGSTPSMEFADARVVNELRPGVYLLNDAQQWELGSCSPDSIAIWAVGTVVSARDGRIVTDIGSKTLGADRAGYATGYGRLLDYPDARVVMLSEHHSVVELNGAPLPQLGSKIRIAPNHVCNAMNLQEIVFDQAFIPVAIDARGRNS